MDTPRQGFRRAAVTSWALVGLGVAGVAGASALAYSDTVKPAVVAVPADVAVPQQAPEPPPVTMTPPAPLPPPPPADHRGAGARDHRPVHAAVHPRTGRTAQHLGDPGAGTRRHPDDRHADHHPAPPHPDHRDGTELLAAHHRLARLMTAPARQLDLTQRRWQRWSTDMHLVVTDPAALPQAGREVDAELDAIDAAASRFRSDSEITALCASGGRPMRVSALLAELLGAALDAAHRTDGDVDPTLGADLVALGYDREIALLDRPEAPGRRVPQRPCRAAVTLAGRIATVAPGVLLDLGATAKAVAADRCAARVQQATGSGVLVNLGGDIATAGPAPAGGWQVLVHDEPGDPASRVALTAGAALATSSTVRRRWRSGADTVHHILDPRTGRCADPVWRTVSVGARTCLEANTLSTAAIVRGRPALNWLAGQGVSARLIDAERGVHTVGGWPAGD